MKSAFEKERVAALFGLPTEELPAGWEAFAEQPKGSVALDKWLEDFLNEAPSLKAAFEKGTICIERLQDGSITMRCTPDYYLDLARRFAGKDLFDPWDKDAKPVYVEGFYRGFNPDLENDHPANRKWACKMAVDAETRRKGFLKQTGFKSAGLYSRVAVPQLGA